MPVGKRKSKEWERRNERIVAIIPPSEEKSFRLQSSHNEAAHEWFSEKGLRWG
jgi:hypothetical protein